MVNFPMYNWLKSLDDKINYQFLIFGDYSGAYGCISYYYDNSVGNKMLSYVVCDGRHFYNEYKISATEEHYNMLQERFLIDRQTIISDLLSDKSNTWICNNTVNEYCCIPF